MDAFTYAHSNYFNEGEYKFSKSNFDIRTKRAKLDQKLTSTQYTQASSTSRWRSQRKETERDNISTKRSVMNNIGSVSTHRNKAFINKALFMIKRNYFTKVEKHLSTALSTRINRQKRHGIKDGESHQKILLLINNLYKIKDEVNNHMQRKDITSAIECMLEILEFSISTNDSFLLLQTTMEIGYMYKMFGRIGDAICTFNHLKTLCELLRNPKIKVQAIIQIAEISLNMKNFDASLKLLKKVLEICVAYDLRELEALIYEKMGIVYYYMRDLTKAKFFHNKSLNFEVEEKESILRDLCKNRLILYNQTYPMPYFKNLNKFFLKRVMNFFPIVYNKDFTNDYSKDEENELVELSDMERSKKNRFTSKLKAEDQLNFILEDKEFENLLPTPRENKKENERLVKTEAAIGGKTTSEASFKTYLNIIQKKKESGKKDVSSSINNASTTFTSMKFEQLATKTSSIKCSIPSIPQETKKLPLDQKILMRIKLGKALDSSKYLTEMSTHMKRKMKNETLNDKIHINHLTVNRNIEMFENSCNFDPKKINGYFDKIISKQFVRSFFDKKMNNSSHDYH